MSKRSADIYVTRDDKYNEGGGVPAPQGRLTSAQMANRKIAVPRGARRGGAARPRPGLGATSASIQQQQQQQSLPNFGQPSPSISGGFTFGQQSNTVAPNQTSQSFPPFGNSSTNSNNNDTSTNTFSFTAPSTAFSFNTMPANNPFSNLNGASSMPPQTTGFQGSIFNFQATPDATQNNGTAQATSLFTQPAQEMSNPSQSSSDPAFKATANPFTWPSAQQPANQVPNPFSQSLSATQQPSTFLQPSNPADAVNDPSTNIFANLKSQSNQSNENSNAKGNHMIFGNLQQKDPTPSPGPANPFAASIAKFQEDRKTRPTNFFNHPASHSSSSVFNSQPELHSFAADSMQTSPEGTPRDPGGDQVPGPEANGSSADRIASPISSTTRGLFDRVTRPESEPIAHSSYQFSGSADSQTSGLSVSAKRPQSQHSSSLNGTSAADSTLEQQNGTTPLANKPHSGQDGDWENTEAQEGVKSTSEEQSSSFQPNASPMLEEPSFSSSSSTVRPESDYVKPHNEISTPGLDRFYGIPMPPFENGDRRLATIAWRLHVLHFAVVHYLDLHGEHVDLESVKDFYHYKVGAIHLAGEGPMEVLPTWAYAWLEILDEHQSNRAEPFSTSTSGLLTSDEQSADHDDTIADSQQTQVLQPLPTSKPKRKADDQPLDGEMSTNGSSAKRVRATEESPMKSQTSNLFSTILDSKQEDLSPRESEVPGGRSIFNGSTAQASGLSLPPARSGAISEHCQPIFSSVKASAATSSRPDHPGPSTNPFAGIASPVRQPTNSNVDPVQNSKPGFQQALQLPQFGNAPPGGWMAQFSQIAQQDEEKAKEKRKAEDYDSEEEDEAAWEQRDAETQRRKKQEIAEATRSAKKFIPNFGTLSSLPDFKNETPSTVTNQPKPKSIFDTTHPAFGQNSHRNIFGHLANESRDDGGSKHADADKEHDEEHDEEQDDEEKIEQPRSLTQPNLFGNSTASAPSIGRSLFDRVSKPANDTSQSGPDVRSTADHPTGDHTWKVDSPIKFGPTTSSPSGPSVNIESPSPSKNTFAGLFGASTVTPTGDKAPKTGTSIFSNLPSSTPSGAVGFGFTPAQPNVSNLNAPSNQSSRAPSPGLTTGDSAAESTAEGAEESIEQHSQLDLMSGRVGEEDENVVYEVRAKATSMDSQAKEFVSRGVGPLRILKHRTTGQPRALLRADPGGRIALNSGLMKQGKYKNIGANTVSGPFADSKGMVGAWRLRVKTADEATQLLQALEQNTPSSA